MGFLVAAAIGLGPRRGAAAPEALVELAFCVGLLATLGGLSGRALGPIAWTAVGGGIIGWVLVALASVRATHDGDGAVLGLVLGAPLGTLFGFILGIARETKRYGRKAPSVRQSDTLWDDEFDQRP